MAPVLALQSALKIKGRVLHTHRIGQLAHARAKARRLNSALLINRAFALW